MIKTKFIIITRCPSCKVVKQEDVPYVVYENNKTLDIPFTEYGGNTLYFQYSCFFCTLVKYKPIWR